MSKKPASNESNKQSEGSAPPESEALTIGAKEVDSQGAQKDMGAGHSDTRGAIDLLATIGEEMPAVQQHAIDAENSDASAAAKLNGTENTAQNTAQNPKPSGDGPFDVQGRSFNPDIHVSENGKPKLSATTGKLLCKRGRKAGGTNKTQSTLGPDNSSVNGGTQTADAQNLDEKCRATAAVTSELIFTLGQATMGTEWAPRTDNKIGLDERAHMTGAWCEYYKATGIIELPPWLGVAVALGAYAGPRFFMPQTKARALSWKEKVYAWFARRKARKENAQSKTRSVYDMEEVNGASASTIPLTP